MIHFEWIFICLGAYFCLYMSICLLISLCFYEYVCSHICVSAITCVHIAVFFRYTCINLTHIALSASGHMWHAPQFPFAYYSFISVVYIFTKTCEWISGYSKLNMVLSKLLYTNFSSAFTACLSVLPIKKTNQC